MNEYDMELIVNNVTYKAGYSLRLLTSNRPYLQVVCQRPDSATGEPGIGYGGKVFLSEHMVESEVVRKAFQAFSSYEEHECREFFRYEGLQVFGPHIDVRALMEIANRKEMRP